MHNFVCIRVMGQLVSRLRRDEVLTLTNCSWQGDAELSEKVLVPDAVRVRLTTHELKFAEAPPYLEYRAIVTKADGSEQVWRLARRADALRVAQRAPRSVEVDHRGCDWTPMQEA